MTQELLLELTPVDRNWYDVYLDGKLIVTSNRPLCDAARELFLIEGYHPDTILSARYSGSITGILQSTVGAASGLTIVEIDSETFAFVACGKIYPVQLRAVAAQ